MSSPSESETSKCLLRKPTIPTKVCSTNLRIETKKLSVFYFGEDLISLLDRIQNIFWGSMAPYPSKTLCLSVLVSLISHHLS